MQLNWIKCQGDVWGNLNTVNLAHAHFDSMSGVYVIWHGGGTPRTVRVGQGNIRDRLTAHRSDPDVQKYVGQTLYVTWASVPEASRDGVEAYLADILKPLEGQRFPNSTPIAVNLPW
ncbi:MAG: hypothetical protein PHY02_03290 [Phycisphaerae bacterium]|nr:hypothetical protein [Phycisphaerae bacterium]